MAAKINLAGAKLFLDGADLHAQISELRWTEVESASRLDREEREELRAFEVTLSHHLGLTVKEAVAVIEKNPELRVKRTEISRQRGCDQRTKIVVHPGRMDRDEAFRWVQFSIMNHIAKKRRKEDDDRRAAEEAKRQAARMLLEVLRRGDLGGGNSRQTRKRLRAAARSAGIAWATIQGRRS